MINVMTDWVLGMGYVILLWHSLSLPYNYFDSDIVNFPFLDGDVLRRPSYGVYISQLIRFALVCSHVDDFNTRNKCLTAKLFKQGPRYQKIKRLVQSSIADTMNWFQNSISG